MGYIGWPEFYEISKEMHGQPRLLDISVYAAECAYYSFGCILLLCSFIAMPMVYFRITMLKKFGVSKIHRENMIGWWVLAMIGLQVMGWTNFPTNEILHATHFISALVGFSCLVTALMYDQIIVYRMKTIEEDGQKMEAIISFILLGLTIISWILWVMFSKYLVECEWLGVVLTLGSVFIWIPQNLRFYDSEPLVEVSLADNKTLMYDEKNVTSPKIINVQGQQTSIDWV